MGSHTMTIPDIEAVAARLRKYAISPADANAIAEALAAAVEGPVQVEPADLASIMRPRRIKRPSPNLDPEVVQRREALREKINSAWCPGSVFSVSHHPADVKTVTSAVQYRARKEGIKYALRRVGAGWVEIRLTAR